MSVVLILGGSGTLGYQVIPLLLKNPRIERVRILSRGEHRQMEMEEHFKSSKLDFFVGDVRDFERVKRASADCEQVYHFAAMKSVDKAEYDPWEAVQTNIHGTKNVIEACLQNQVSRAIFTSTDKAVAPLNIYGASKLVAEKLFIQANIGRHRARFAVCRYGNVLGSQGSVLVKWKENLAQGKKLKITDPEMTRFFILPSKAAEFVIDSMNRMYGGEVFIPKMKSTTMLSLLSAFNKNAGDLEYVEPRPGEKVHEVLIGEDEVDLTTDCGDHFIRWPNHRLFPVLRHGVPISFGFNSNIAERFTREELLEMIKCLDLD